MGEAEHPAASPGGSVAPRRNNEGRGAVDWKATFHSLFSHAPDYLISCEQCECPSRSDGPPPVGCPCSEQIAPQGVPSRRDAKLEADASALAAELARQKPDGTLDVKVNAPAGVSVRTL